MPVASPEQYLANLNPPQREAVLHTEGPLLVIAGAGSGKTRVLTHRVAHLITAIGVKPNEILAITFTNKAAGEMRERLTNMLGPVARAIWILTFHAACGRILRREAERLGYKSNFTIYDSADQVRLVKQVLEELDKDPKRFVPRGVHAQISNAKNQLITPAMYAEQLSSFYEQTVAEVLDNAAAVFDQIFEDSLRRAAAGMFAALETLTFDELACFLHENRATWYSRDRPNILRETATTLRKIEPGER